MPEVGSGISFISQLIEALMEVLSEVTQNKIALLYSALVHNQDSSDSVALLPSSDSHWSSGLF